MKHSDNTGRTDIGERIDQLRAEKKLTLKKLAGNLFISDGALSMKMSGKRPFTVDELLILSDIFGITLDELVRGVRTKNVTAHRATGLSQKAISALNRYNLMEHRRMKALDFALSHQQVLDAIARYVSFVPERKGYFLSERVSEDDHFVYCSMSQAVYKSVLGQNLINMLDEIRTGKEYSREYEVIEDFAGTVESDEEQPDGHGEDNNAQE